MAPPRRMISRGSSRMPAAPSLRHPVSAPGVCREELPEDLCRADLSADPPAGRQPPGRSPGPGVAPTVDGVQDDGRSVPARGVRLPPYPRAIGGITLRFGDALRGGRTVIMGGPPRRRVGHGEHPPPDRSAHHTAGPGDELVVRAVEGHDRHRLPGRAARRERLGHRAGDGTDAGDPLGERAGQPVGEDPAVGDARREDALGIDRVGLDEFGDQRRDEPDIIDLLPFGGRRPPPSLQCRSMPSG